MAWQLYVLEFPNGKRYFGITSKGLARRWAQHRVQARGRSRLPVHAAIRKYGVDEVLLRTAVVGEKDYILALEVAAIARFGTRDREHGYNVSLGGDTSPASAPEVAAKISSSRQGIVFTQEHRSNLSLSHQGKKQSQETIDRRAAKTRGQIRSRDFCDRMVEVNTGRQVSDESRERMRIARLRKPQILTEIRHSSGFRGVSWDAARGAWRVYLKSEGRRFYLGQHSSTDEGARAYDAKAREIWGPSAITNFPL